MVRCESICGIQLAVRRKLSQVFGGFSLSPTMIRRLRGGHWEVESGKSCSKLDNRRLRMVGRKSPRVVGVATCVTRKLPDATERLTNRIES